MPLTLLDLFSGIGGLSLGFEQAGFICVAGVEHNPHHQAAFKHLHPLADVSFQDVASVEAVSLKKTLGIARGELAVIVGGPPCQPFSLAGKRRGREDSRGTLVHEFVRIVGEMLPRSFVMENVQGLMSIHDGALLREVIEDLEGFGYSVAAPRVLNAADFGVPQIRRRLFLVGLRRCQNAFEYPKPTHLARDSSAIDLFDDPRPRFVTVHDAISDLPQNGPGRDSQVVADEEAVPYVNAPLGPYQRLMRERRSKVTGNQITDHFPHIIEAIARLEPGEEEPSTRYRRLFADRPSFTLRAGSGSFTALRPIHPTRARVITVREAARLQSFPDRVSFAPAKKWAYQEIGNSVPPLLGKAIAIKLAEYLT